ncbi:hypothetical protein [Shewanella baltica]|uniref:hypothetical protein n=1 Tax=Shewanella baltica TaxID=62322 RepID=UPI0002185C78|nr:hypothetical protein [Shewanella baltica]AEH14020.1 hypothetical protein Sbal117_2299 [Shewanella baltica OS117]
MLTLKFYRQGLSAISFADNPYKYGTTEHNDFERGYGAKLDALQCLSKPLGKRKPSYRDKSFRK